MTIIVIRAQKIVRYFFVLTVVIGIIYVLMAFGLKSMEVFAANSQIPIYSVECEGKKAAITFDCAWGSGDIPNILETLRKENVKATFFIVGQWAEKYPDSVKMIAREDHDIGNHSYSHLRMGALDQARLRYEISKCGDVLGELTGKKIELFRAPYGDFSNNLVNTAKQLGYFTIQWDVDSITCI